MSLYKRGKVWWSRIERDGEVIQRSTKCWSKKDARDVESAWRTAHAKGEVGIHDQSNAPQLHEFEDKFFAYLPAHVSHSTLTMYKVCWKPLMAHVDLATTRLHRIDQRLIADFTQARLDQGVQRDTVNASLRVLRRALRLAQEWDLIRKAPKITMLAGVRSREFIISEELLVKLQAKCSDTLRDLLPFLIDTGLRISEACDLTWETISLEPKEGAARGWVQVLKGKTKFSKRYVPLTTRAASILKQQKLESRCQWVWTCCNGRRKLNRTYVSAMFGDIKNGMGLPWDAVLHSTRHTFCTRLGERGADAFTIRSLAGHSSIVVSQRYVHPTPPRLESAIGLLEPAQPST